MTDWTSLTYVVVDVEGNGQQPPDLVEPIFDDIKHAVLEALDTDGLIAHNAHVDVGVFQRKLGEWECPETFDTLPLARRLLPGADSYKLGGLVEAFKLDEDLPEGLTPHRATYDALVTARLFIRLATLPDRRTLTTLTLEEFRNKPTGRDNNDTPALF